MPLDEVPRFFYPQNPAESYGYFFEKNFFLQLSGVFWVTVRGHFFGTLPTSVVSCGMALHMTQMFNHQRGGGNEHTDTCQTHVPDLSCDIVV